MSHIVESMSPDKTEWGLISATLCGWRRRFVADQLWFMTCVREEEVWQRLPAANTPHTVSPAGNRCHFVLLDKDESYPTADLQVSHRLPNGLAYSTGKRLNTPDKLHIARTWITRQVELFFNSNFVHNAYSWKILVFFLFQKITIFHFACGLLIINEYLQYAQIIFFFLRIFVRYKHL